MRVSILGLTLALAAGCTNSEHAQHVLEGAGYTEVKMTGYRALACSKDDTLRDGFVARGPTGRAVAGAVCCGAFGKGCTIRVD